MIYQMNLNDEPFQLILSGRKEVEMRLATPEKCSIRSGDHIVFTNRKSGEKLEVLVLNIVKFPTFKELYDKIDHIKLGYNTPNGGDFKDMYLYYKEEDILQNGVLAIYIQKVSAK